MASYYRTQIGPYSSKSYFIPVVVPFIIGAWLGGLKDSMADIRKDNLESRL